jgi:hypothetical protein
MSQRVLVLLWSVWAFAIIFWSFRSTDMAAPQTYRTQPDSCSMFVSKLAPISSEEAAMHVKEMTKVMPTTSLCPLFMRHYTHPLKSWMSDGINIFAPHRGMVSCEDGAFCNHSRVLHERLEGTFYRHQHPADCGQARFLILTKEWPAGLGSVIHTKASMLMLAAHNGRVLIDSPHINWTCTNPQSCPSKDWSCYFAPLTNCTLPLNWESLAEPFSHAAKSQYTTSSPSPNLISDLTEYGFASQPPPWWFAQASAYLVRPNARTLSAVCYAWECIMPGRKYPPRPLASIFIRRGDKWKEAKLREPYEYFALLDKFNVQNHFTKPIGDVYVGTDDAHMLKTAIEFRNYSLFFINYPRETGGLKMDAVDQRFQTPLIEWQVLMSLSDLLIAASSDLVIGTISSNWCRLINELRLVQGKTYPFPGFLSLDNHIPTHR